MLGAGSRVDRLRLRLELIASQWGPGGVTRHPGWGVGGSEPGDGSPGKPEPGRGGRGHGRPQTFSQASRRHPHWPLKLRQPPAGPGSVASPR